MGYEELKIEGRNAVLEAFRSGKTIDKLFVLDGCQDGPVRTIVREAKKHDTIVHFVEKERLDQLSETKKHQGVIACTYFSHRNKLCVRSNDRPYGSTGRWQRRRSEHGKLRKKQSCYGNRRLQESFI